MSISYSRYLLDLKWFKQWKTYVGFDGWSTDFVGKESSSPGPIDNGGLLQGIQQLIIFMDADKTC